MKRLLFFGVLAVAFGLAALAQITTSPDTGGVGGGVSATQLTNAITGRLYVQPTFRSGYKYDLSFFADKLSLTNFFLLLGGEYGTNYLSHTTARPLYQTTGTNGHFADPAICMWNGTVWIAHTTESQGGNGMIGIIKSSDWETWQWHTNLLHTNVSHIAWSPRWWQEGGTNFLFYAAGSSSTFLPAFYFYTTNMTTWAGPHRLQGDWVSPNTMDGIALAKDSGGIYRLGYHSEADADTGKLLLAQASSLLGPYTTYADATTNGVGTVWHPEGWQVPLGDNIAQTRYVLFCDQGNDAGNVKYHYTTTTNWTNFTAYADIGLSDLWSHGGGMVVTNRKDIDRLLAQAQSGRINEALPVHTFGGSFPFADSTVAGVRLGYPPRGIGHFYVFGGNQYITGPATSGNSVAGTQSTNLIQLDVTAPYSVRINPPLVANAGVSGSGAGLTNLNAGGGTGLLGSTAAGVTLDVDTEAELEASIGSVNIITAPEIDTSAELAGILTDESGAAGVFPRFSLTSLAADETVKWNGTSWVNTAFPTGVSVAAGTNGMAAVTNGQLVTVHDTGIKEYISVATLAAGVVNATNLALLDTGGDHSTYIKHGANLTANRTNTFVFPDANATHTFPTATSTLAAINDTAFASSWNGVTSDSPSKNAVHDWGVTFDTDYDGKVNVLDLGAGMVKTDANGVTSVAVAGTDYATHTSITNIYEFSFGETNVLTTGTAKITWRAPHAMTLVNLRASLSTASSSGIPTVDINEGGTTVISTKLTIDANEKTSTTAATAFAFSDTAIADDAEITFDIDVAGTGAAGLKVKIYYTR